MGPPAHAGSTPPIRCPACRPGRCCCLHPPQPLRLDLDPGRVGRAVPVQSDWVSPLSGKLIRPKNKHSVIDSAVQSFPIEVSLWSCTLSPPQYWCQQKLSVSESIKK